MENKSIIIRPVEEGDLLRVFDILQSVSKFEPEAEGVIENWFRFSSQSNVLGVVATIDERIVGYGAILFELKIRGGLAGHIEDIASDIDFQGIGVGRRIVNSLCEIAKRKGCYKVSLQCRDHNIKFYEKCSFLTNGQTMQRML